MTKRDVCQVIKAMGLTAKYSSEWQEFIINYRQDDSRRSEDSSYHTDDADDAIGTAKIMANWNS